MMKDINSNFLKIISAIFVLSLYFSSINTQHAYAACAATTPGTDLCAPLIQLDTAKTKIEVTTSASANIATAGSVGANQVTSLAEYSWSTVGKNALDAAAYSMAQRLLSRLTENTVAWIQGGFHGSPNFNVDVKEAALEVADEVAGGFVLSLKNLSVCDFTLSYKDDLVTAVERSVKKRPYTYQQKAVCPFNQNYVFKASDFYEDFNKGGWEMMGAALSDGGNPYSVQMLTAQELASREAAAKATADKKANWSNGFADIIDTEDCNYPLDIYSTADEPDKGIYPDALQDANGNWGRYEYASGPGPDGNPIPPVWTPVPGMGGEEAARRNEKKFSDPKTVAALQKEHCKTTTPGKIVGDQLTKSLGIDMDRIGFADNMNKIVSAFINTVMQEAVRGVFGKGNRTTAGSNVIPSTGTAPEIQAPTLSVLATNNITSTTAELTGSLLYTGPASVRLRAWFVVKNADATTPWTRWYEILPGGLRISPQPTSRYLSLNAAELLPGNTYMVTTVYTTGLSNLVPPTATNPGNGIAGSGEISFTTLP